MYCNRNKEIGVPCEKQCEDCHKAQSMADNSDGLTNAFKSVIEEGVMEFWGLKEMIKLTLLCAEREEAYKVAAKLRGIQEELGF